MASSPGLLGARGGHLADKSYECTYLSEYLDIFTFCLEKVGHPWQAELAEENYSMYAMDYRMESPCWEEAWRVQNGSRATLASRLSPHATRTCKRRTVTTKRHCDASEAMDIPQRQM